MKSCPFIPKRVRTLHVIHTFSWNRAVQVLTFCWCSSHKENFSACYNLFCYFQKSIFKDKLMFFTSRAEAVLGPSPTSIKNGNIL